MIERFGRLGDSTLRTDPDLRFIPPGTRRYWEWMAASSLGAEVAPLRSLDQETVLRLHQAGVPLLAGSDFPNPYVFPGVSLHQELALLVEAGLSPLEALRTATIGPARFLGSTDSLGAVAPGLIADLVLLDGDPLADIVNTRRIHAVIQGGRVLDRNLLDRVLNESAALAEDSTRSR